METRPNEGQVKGLKELGKVGGDQAISYWVGK
jgi:hypothetical protein